MKLNNYSACRWRRWLLVATFACCVCPGAISAQECASPTLNFAGQFPLEAEVSTTVGAGYKLAEHDVTNVASVSVRPTASGLPVYIVATVANGKLTLTTSDQFAVFEQLDDKLLFLNVVVFECAAGTMREMTYRQNIKEENNYAPLFGREQYDIKVPLPLPRDFNLMQFVDDGRGVVANDYDITKNAVTFAIDDNDYFRVTSSGGATRTEFLANLITKQTLTKIQPPVTLTIYAEDAWDPPRKGQSRLTISGDPVIVFVAPPEFEQGLYRASYKRGGTFTPVRVALAPGTYDASVQYQVSGEDAASFDVSETASDGRSATVRLRPGTPIDEARTILSVTLSATRTGTEGVGRTALVVELTSDPVVLPAFEAALYTGTVAANRDITLDAAIRLVPASTGGSVVTVQLGGDDAQYFTASLANNQVTVGRSTLLTDAVLQANSFFLVTVRAVKASVGTGETLLVLSVARAAVQAPHFEQPVYEGTVTEAGVLSLPTVQLAPGSPPNGLTFSYAGDVSLFVITPDASGTFAIAANGITPEALADKGYLLLTIAGRADDAGEPPAHAVIVVRVLRAAVVLPRFTQVYLAGQLEEKTLELRLPNVELEPASFASGSTEVRLLDDQGLFGMLQYFPDNVYQLFLLANVTSASLRALDRIPLRVEASNPNSDTAHCVVTVDVVRVTPPAFERLLYDGAIDDSRQLTAPLTAKLTAESADETVQYALDGPDATLFTLEPLEPAASAGVAVRLRAALTDSEYEGRALFQLRLRATKQLAATDAIVPIVVQVQRPLVKVPTFEKPLYKSRVTAALQLLPFETIRLEPGSVLDSATVAVRNSNTEEGLFGVTLAQGVVSIQLLHALDPAAVDAVDRFEFLVECSNPAMASGYATILVDIERTAEPEFSALFYAGTVQEGAKAIAFGQKVTLTEGTGTDGSGDTVYSVQGADGALVRHVVAPADRSLSFFLRDEVTVEQLRHRSELSFVVVASHPRTAKPATAACSVTIVRQPRPQFTQSSFVGTLVEGQTVVDFGAAPIAWETGTVTGATEFTLAASAPVDLFEVTLAADLRDVTVRLRADTKWDQVRPHAYFRLVLQAVNAAAAAAGAPQPATECTLVVEVRNQPTVTPTFTKAIYRGSLQQGAREVIFSAAETITVDSGTVTPTLQYATAEGDADLFALELVDGNRLQVSLVASATATTIEGRDLLSFNININNRYSAVDTATVVITVKLDEIISPAFGKLLYNGTVREGTSQLRFDEAIVLSGGTFTDNTELGIGGSGARFFTATRVGSRVELALVEPLDWAELTATAGSYLGAYIQATNPGSDTTATAFVLVDIEPIRQPRFAPAAVHGSIESGSREVTFLGGSELALVASSGEPGLQWNLAGADYQLFDGALGDGLFRFRLKDSVTAAQLGARALYQFSVTVRNPDSDTAESRVIVSRKLPAPRFAKPVYYGAFEGDQLRLSLPEAVQLAADSFTPGTTVTVSDSNVAFLTVEQSERTVEVKPTRALTPEDFQGLAVVHLVLEAQLSDDIRGTCSLLLTVPEGTPCLPLPPVVDCTSCYNCTGAVQDDVPVFPYGNSRYQLRSDTSGPIGSVTATAADPAAIVEHQLDISDEYLKQSLSITPEGTLSLRQPIVPSVYSFFVHATNTVARKRSSASVLLNVLSAYECPTGGTKASTVEQTLVVHHLDEERPHSTILPAQLGPSCAYELLSESPTDALRPYFALDPATRWLTSRSFDRENGELFGGMVVPQFRLLLKLNCAADASRSRPKRSLVDTDTINYAPDVTVVSIIVDDINDNDPVFTQPGAAAGDAVHLGYPEPALASRLMLTQLTHVAATDADAGLNAKLRYSLSDAATGHFVIDPTDGTVHPARDALRGTTRAEFEAVATDRDGAADGRSARLPLTVHRLASEQIAVVTLVPADETTLESVIELINRQDGFHLQLLHQAYVPTADAGRSARQTKLDARRAMRLVVYALDGNREPLSTDAIRSGIRRAVPSIDSSAIVSLDEAVCSTVASTPCTDALSGRGSNAGLVASTSVLGALLLISLAVGGVLYMRYVRPLANSASDPSDIVQLENDFDPSPPSTPPAKRDQPHEPTTAPPAGEDINEVHDRKISINIAGITMHESEDVGGDSQRLARTLNERLDEEDEYGMAPAGADTYGPEMASSEPKNVKFNEVVERIEVQEHHSDDEDDDDDDDDDGDETGGGEVYEERL